MVALLVLCVLCVGTWQDLEVNIQQHLGPDMVFSLVLQVREQPTKNSFKGLKPQTSLHPENKSQALPRFTSWSTEERMGDGSWPAIPRSCSWRVQLLPKWGGGYVDCSPPTRHGTSTSEDCSLLHLLLSSTEAPWDSLCPSDSKAIATFCTVSTTPVWDPSHGSSASVSQSQVWAKQVTLQREPQEPESLISREALINIPELFKITAQACFAFRKQVKSANVSMYLKGTSAE